MHDDKMKGYDYDAMRHPAHGDPHDMPSHGHRHPAYDFPDVYHPVPYGKEFLGNQPISLQDPTSGHIVHPCPPRDWGRHGEPHMHEHFHEAPHVPPVHDYLSEYVGLLEDYFHKDKGLDDCDCGEAIRHLRSEIRALLKAMEHDLKGLGNEYESIKSKLAYYIGKTQACIQTTEEYMLRQETIDADWAEMKETFGQLIEEWEEFGATMILRYSIDENGNITDVPVIEDMLESLVSEMPTITDVIFFNTTTDVDFIDEKQVDEFADIVYKHDGTTQGTYAEYTTFMKMNNIDSDNVYGSYYVIYDRIELIEECEDKKVTNHPEKWQRTEGYPYYEIKKDYSQGTTDKAVKTRMLDDKAVTNAKLGDNAVTSDKIGDGEVKTADIDNSAVTTAKLANNAVTTAKITDKNVTNAKLADDAVTSDKIADGAVHTADLANSSVTTAKIADDNVTEDKLSSAVRTKLNKDDNTTYTLTKSGSTITLTGSDGSTTSVTDTDEDHNTTYTLTKSGSTITLTGSDGSTTSVTDADSQFTLEDGTVTTAKLANSAVTRAKINNSAVGTDQLGSGAVTEAKIGNGEVTEAKLSTAVQNKLNTDNDTTYTLTKSGSTITLTGSDGSTTSVTDDAGTGGDGNTTYTLTKSGSTITLNGSDGSTTSVSDANTDTNTTYSLSKSGSTITLTGSDGSTSSVSDADTDTNTTYTLSENNRRLVLTDSNGGTSTATITDVGGTAYDVALTTEGVFNGYLRCYKAGGLVTICTEEANTVATAFASKTYTKICTLPAVLKPTRLVDTVAIVADKLTNFRVNTNGEVYVYVFYEDASTVPTGWHLHASLAYQHV